MDPDFYGRYVVIVKISNAKIWLLTSWTSWKTEIWIAYSQFEFT